MFGGFGLRVQSCGLKAVFLSTRRLGQREAVNTQKKPRHPNEDILVLGSQERSAVVGIST